MRTGKLVVLFVAFLCCGLAAQTPNLQPSAPANAKVPTIAFDFALPGATPGHYSIALDSAGRAGYRSEEVPQPGATPGEPYLLKFVISEPTRLRIFDLARQLSFFKGDFEYHGGRVANMGAKTFTYTDGEHQSQTTVNYSSNPQMEELVRIFQEISLTLEHGRRLEYLHRYDKLGLDAELKSMEDDARQKELCEVQAVKPVLQKILDDHSVMNITRRRAEHILALAQANPAAQQAAPQ